MDKKHSRSLSGSIDNTDGHNNEELTIASPAEFVQRFGGNRVIEKVWVRAISDAVRAYYLLKYLYVEMLMKYNIVMANNAYYLVLRCQWII